MKIFVSYTIRDGMIDKYFLNNLSKQITQYCPVYIDLLHNNSIDKQKRVLTELINSNYIFLIKTNQTEKSKWVELELKYAQKYNIPIIEFDYKEIIEENYVIISNKLKNIKNKFQINNQIL